MSVSNCCKTTTNVGESGGGGGGGVVVGMGERDELNNDETQSLLTSSSSSATTTTTVSQSASEANKAKQTLLGMVLVALGTGLFCSVGAVVQYHGGSVIELLLGRYIVQNIIAWIIWIFKRPQNCHSWYGDPPFRANIWARGILYWLTTFCWWRGLEMVPLGDGEAILFLSPILTVIAARLYLKEKLPKSFFFTLIVTLAGLVFICQPEFVFSSSDTYQTMSWKGLLFLIGADLAWSGTCVLVRTAKSAHWLQMETVSTTQAVFIWTPMVILLNQLWWHSPGFFGGGWDFHASSFGIMALVGTLGFTALMLNVIGYQIGDATKVAWMEYLDLVFAFLYQWLAFGDVPNAWEFIGCACLLSTCGIHLMEEVLTYWKHSNEEAAAAAENEEQAASATGDLSVTGDHSSLLSEATLPLLQKNTTTTFQGNSIDMSSNGAAFPEATLVDDMRAQKLKFKIVKELALFSADASADSASDMEKMK